MLWASLKNEHNGQTQDYNSYDSSCLFEIALILKYKNGDQKPHKTGRHRKATRVEKIKMIIK